MVGNLFVGEGRLWVRGARRMYVIRTRNYLIFGTVWDAMELNGVLYGHFGMVWGSFIKLGGYRYVR